MKNFIFNKHNVCLNPEAVLALGTKYHTNNITLDVAQHPDSGKWCAGCSWCSKQGGFGSPVWHDSLRLETGYDSREEAILSHLSILLSYEKNFSANEIEILNQLRVSLGQAETGDQLLLF